MKIPEFYCIHDTLAGETHNREVDSLCQLMIHMCALWLCALWLLRVLNFNLDYTWLDLLQVFVFVSISNLNS